MMKTWVSLIILGLFVIAAQTPAALIHHWKLDESELTWNGSVWVGVIDSVGGNPTGELWGYSAADPVNTTVFNQVGPHGSSDMAYNFIEPSGISGVNTNNKTAVPETGDFTILVQMKTVNLQSAQGHLFSNNNGQSNRCNLYVHNGALMWFHNGGVSLQESDSPIFDGLWHEVGISRQGDHFYLLRDGFVVDSQTTGSSNVPISQAQNWCIGRQRSFAGDYDGLIGDVKIYNQVYTQVIKTRTFDPIPANQTIDVDTEITLQWNTALDPANPLQPNPAVTKHYLYINTEPNFVDTTPISIAATGATGSYPVDLLMDKTYYWRVDESIYDTAAGDPNTVKGFIWSFETQKSVPVIIEQPDKFVLADAGQAADITVDVQSLSPAYYTWYKSADNANNTPIDDIVVGGPTLDGNRLTIENVQIDDEGFYYCKIVNATGEQSAVFSNTSIFRIKKLLGHWPLDGNPNDESGNGNHGTLLGTFSGQPIWEVGIDGQALNAYGTIYIEIPNESFFDRYDTMTVSAWVKGTDFGEWSAFVSKHASITGWELVKHGQPDAAGFIVRRGADYLRYENLLGIKNIEDGNWHLVTGILNGITGQRQLYVDGLLEASASYDYTRMQNGGDAPVRIAVTQFDTSLGSPVKGLIDDVKIYNYPMDPLEIAQEYTSISGMPVCLTPSSWDFNGDCKVDLEDFADFATNWLECGLVPVSKCP